MTTVEAKPADIEVAVPESTTSTSNKIEPSPSPSLRRQGSISISGFYKDAPEMGTMDRQIYDAMKRADTDGSGSISKDELKDLVVTLVESHKETAHYKKRACIATVLAVVLLLVSFGLTALAVTLTVTMGASNGLLVGKDGQLIGAAAAFHTVTIEEAAELTPEQLSHVQTISVTHSSGRYEGYHVTHFIKYSAEHVEFFLADTTKTLVVSAGVAYLHETIYPPLSPPMPPMPPPAPPSPPMPPLEPGQTWPPPPPPDVDPIKPKADEKVDGGKIEGVEGTDGKGAEVDENGDTKDESKASDDDTKTE